MQISFGDELDKLSQASSDSGVGSSDISSHGTVEMYRDVLDDSISGISSSHSGDVECEKLAVKQVKHQVIKQILPVQCPL